MTEESKAPATTFPYKRITDGEVIPPADTVLPITAPSAPVMPGSGAAHSSPPAAFRRGVDGGDPHVFFNKVFGTLPFIPPNVKDEQDLYHQIHDRSCIDPLQYPMCLCCLATPVLGWSYLYGKMILVKQGDWGFVMNNGVPDMLLPGRYFIASCVNHVEATYSSGQDVITVGPITIVRVHKGTLGFADNGAEQEILLPGLHLRTSAQFKFSQAFGIDTQEIVFGPLKIFLVPSGSVRICFNDGHVEIFEEGRYAVNAGTFQLGPMIDVRQQNLRFNKHPVLLDGGITILVEGLLTFQVIDAEKLVRGIGAQQLIRAIEDITKAELARVFSSVHLEQISAAQQGSSQPHDSKEPQALLGAKPIAGEAEGECRNKICSQVIEDVRGFTATWGVKIINFQLESTKIADEKYAQEYEEASLAIAKAKANKRAVEAENQIMLSKAEAEAKARQIEAEGKKKATIISAQGAADARRIEAEARNHAATIMKEEFARQFAMSGQQVEFARALRAETLCVTPDSSIGSMMVVGNGPNKK